MDPIFPLVEEPRQPVVVPRTPFYDWFIMAGSALMRLSAFCMTVWFLVMLLAGVAGFYLSIRPYHYLGHVFALVGIVAFYLWWTGRYLESAHTAESNSMGWSRALHLFLRNLFVSGLMLALFVYMLHWAMHDYQTMRGS